MLLFFLGLVVGIGLFQIFSKTINPIKYTKRRSSIAQSETKSSGYTPRKIETSCIVPPSKP